MIGPMQVHQLHSSIGGSSLPVIDLNEYGSCNTIRDFSCEIDLYLNAHGALLFRGVSLRGSKKLGSLLTSVFNSELINYDYASTPRTKLRGNVYTSTEFHPSEEIPLHNENAYSNKWPLRIAFYCMSPSKTGGETPIADSRVIYKSLPIDIREEFENRGLRYVRNYSDVDVPWPQVFGTHDSKEVEEYCTSNSIDIEWLHNNQLRTTQITPATRRHPHCNERVWFNQAHLFHISRLTDGDRSHMLRVFGSEHLPRNAYFGDGEPIPEEMLGVIRKTLRDNRIVFSWKAGDLLLLDNMLYCHGRNSYQGSRKILVGMAQSCDGSDGGFQI